MTDKRLSRDTFRRVRRNCKSALGGAEILVFTVGTAVLFGTAPTYAAATASASQSASASTDADVLGEPPPSIPTLPSSGASTSTASTLNQTAADPVVGTPKQSAADSVSSAPSPSAAPPVTELDLFKLESLLNAIVVTAGGGEEEERAVAPASVYTISREEIQLHGWRSLTEALANVPGLYLIDDLVTPAVGVRGVTGGLQSGSRLVKVMIDGTAISYRPDLSAFLGPEFIPIEAVERLEIAKGPLSALYGANAFIATINVITRTPKDGLSATVTLRGNVTRSNPGGGVSGLISYRGQSLWMMAALTMDRVDRSGIQLEKTFETPVSPTLFGRSSSSDLATPLGGYLQLGVTSERLGSLTFAGGVQQLDSGGEFRLNSLLTSHSRVQLTNLWTNLRYDKRWTKASFSINAGYARGAPGRDTEIQITENQSYKFKPNYGYQSVTTGAELSFSPFRERLEFRLNLDFDYAKENVLYYTQIFNRAEGVRMPGDTIDLISDTVVKDLDYFNIGAALQIASTPFKRLPGLRFTGNVRIDKILFGPISYDPQISYRAALSYKFTKHSVIKLIGGRAFQTPSGVLLFGQGRFANVNNVIGTQTLPDLPLLQPQTVDSVELAASSLLFKHLSLEGGVFGQFLTDKIEFVQSGSDFVARNRGTQNSIGVEASARLAFGRFSGYGWGSFLWNFGKISNPPEAYPMLFGLLGLDVSLKEIYLIGNVQARIVGPRGPTQSNLTLNNNQSYPIPSYAAFDINLSTTSLHLFGPSTDTRVLFSARNITAGNRIEPGYAGFDFPNIGASYYLELKQSF